MEKIYSTHQAAQICNVHYTTVIGWIEDNKLKAYATPGGHRRIKEDELLSFMKKFKIPIPKTFARQRKLVLVVDDDAEFLDEIKSAFAGNGFDLDFAKDGFEAAKKIYTKKPDLILLDFRMPGMDGFAVCEELRKDIETSRIPVFAVTVLKSDQEINKIKAHAVREYIPKPADPEELLALIKKTLKIP